MPWNNGAWWPIYVPEWWSPIVSRHPLDPYSFVHLQSGVICFYICGYPIWYLVGGTTTGFDSWPLWVGFGIVFVLSFMFEIIENARCTINKYREASGTSTEYGLFHIHLHRYLKRLNIATQQFQNILSCAGIPPDPEKLWLEKGIPLG